MRLTQFEKDAVLRVLQERLAGCPDDLRDALGCDKTEAVAIWNRLVNAADKLEKDLEAA